MDDSNTWETRRQKLIKMLTIQKETIDLRTLFRELEYPNKKVLINDIMSIARTLKSKGLSLFIYPSSCIACGYRFQQKLNLLKIPSKCPKCRQQRINWPSIKVKS
ncbi:MAG: hypothetical protein ACFFAN_02915 [Promethearchaeota archaeon]